jgi:hypothetical protein
MKPSHVVTRRFSVALLSLSDNHPQTETDASKSLLVYNESETN